VVDDVVCTEGTSDVHIPRATHSRHFRSQRFGNLHDKGADSARCAIDEDFVPRLDPAFVAQTLQGGDACQRHRRRLLERQVGWFRTDPVCGNADVFGVGAVDCPEFVEGTYPLRKRSPWQHQTVHSSAATRPRCASEPCAWSARRSPRAASAWERSPG